MYKRIIDIYFYINLLLSIPTSVMIIFAMTFLLFKPTISLSLPCQIIITLPKGDLHILSSALLTLWEGRKI